MDMVGTSKATLQGGKDKARWARWLWPKCSLKCHHLLSHPGQLIGPNYTCFFIA